ncbi:hypothetical protein AGABI1DRAFT_33856 [Agaricus bisporus var. burnettii JB137-S8]|uniref:Phosphatidylinositol N-acetylglucosaminyltransferase subunit H conserved domain-containing protein n=1 Tax=Agaricus bisporus var. burnettii (strain JB137-S8 / ATCC MYA-4627 / FGSC 10392) TaxID=597362 RepID=K5X4K3_AGABU|nr:uncharacterized protein AGABI1DRAFT_33856 [Agaricus bisporus var. burnettii JB137-S8]EKM82776.1 hypothetical protein AGABI1DRAFT_33856 [Agaricus bisporus var. burnettii JB137-S8]
MRETHPLPDHPEFSVRDYPNYREYRVENRYVARNGSGRIIQKATGLSWCCALFPAFGFWWFAFSIFAATLWLYMKCTQVVAGALLNLHCKHSCLTLNFPTSETVLVIPPHGIQLETHRGLPRWPLAISRRFISLTNLRDVIINEALYGWNVRYYLAAVKEHPSTGFSLDVIFESILPRMPILSEVYHGIHEMLMNGHEDG